MDKPIVIYDEARGKILAKYVENFGKFCEVDVTDQTLQAVFRYLMAYDLTLNEHYEYEFDGDKDSTSLVKQEVPTIDPVKHGKWLHNSDRPDRLICSVCDVGFDMWYYETKDLLYCPCCGAKMDGDKE